MSDGTPEEGNKTELGGWQATLDDKRTIAAFDMGDGSFVFQFRNEDNITEVRLSREAVNAMKALMLCKLNGIDA
jgi:hypothetical protein